MSLSHLMTHDCWLERQSATKDATAGVARSWLSGTAKSFRGNPQAASSGVVLRYGQRDLTVSHTIFVDRDIEATEKDRVRIGVNYYLIQGYRDASTGRGVCFAIDVEQVKGP